MLAWHALRVRPRYEKIAGEILKAKGYEEFVPLHRVRRAWSDRIAELDLPLFPGYVFCHFDIEDRRVPIMSTPGVLQLVGVAEDSEIAAVRQVIASGLAAEPCHYLPIGSRVQVHTGALSGLEGILLQVKKNYQLVISVSLLQRSVAVEIDSAWITPVAQSAHRPADARQLQSTD
jgi:transcription antitermination factor NusG